MSETLAVQLKNSWRMLVHQNQHEKKILGPSNGNQVRSLDTLRYPCKEMHTMYCRCNKIVDQTNQSLSYAACAYQTQILLAEARLEGSGCATPQMRQG